MPISGDFAALAGWYKRLAKLQDASKEIAQAVAPKVEGLVNDTFREQASPEGEAWTPTKSGAPAFGGSDSGGRVFARLVGKSTVRVSVLYPLHFHQDGTHTKGRKFQRAMRRSLRKEGYSARGIRGIVDQFDIGRRAGAYHDPPRPMIPEGDIPAKWADTITSTARPILAAAGATERK